MASLNSVEFYRGNDFVIYGEQTLWGPVGMIAMMRCAIKNIGYWLAERFAKRGIMTKACKELENIGFSLMNLNKLEIRVAEHNEPSKRLAIRLGYISSGVIRDAEWLYDHYVHHVIYSKLLSEYRTVG